MIAAIAVGAAAGMVIGHVARREKIVSQEGEGTVVLSIENALSWLTTRAFKTMSFMVKLGATVFAVSLAAKVGKWTLGLVSPALSAFKIPSFASGLMIG